MPRDQDDGFLPWSDDSIMILEIIYMHHGFLCLLIDKHAQKHNFTITFCVRSISKKPTHLVHNLKQYSLTMRLRPTVGQNAIRKNELKAKQVSDTPFAREHKLRF